MGRTADLYQRLLRQELWDKEYNTKLGVYKGELVTVSDQKMQEAIRKVQKKMNRLVPSKKKAEQKFQRFCDQQNESEQRKDAVHDAESKKRYGDGIKFQQYQKNKDALVKQAAETLRREIAWNNALVRCGLSADQAAKMVDGNARWMKLLMRTGTDAESLAHNDKIMTLLAFGRKQISADEFVSKRVSQCKEYENMNDADAQVLADQEKNGVGNVLWDEVRQVADQSRRVTEDQASYATMVMTGKAGKDKKPSVDQCYRSLGSAAALMCLDLEFCFVSVSTMDGFTNAAEKKKYVGDIQFQTFHDHTTEAYLDFAANPYFSVVDPFKMNAVNDATENTLNNVLPKGKEGTVEEELDEALVNECNQIYFNWINQQRKALAPFGLGIDDQVEYRTNDRTVFRNQDGHMCIVRQLKLDERGPVIVDASHPEDLVDADMKPELDKFLHTCKKWDRKHYTSDQFENMRTDLENLAEADKLGYAPGEYDIKSLENRVKRLQETSKLYLEKKQRETPNGRYKRGYETRRVAFATKLNQFAEKKLKELGYVRAHMATLEASRKAERDLKNDPDFIKTKENPKFSEMTALQYQRKKQQDERTAEARRREAEEQRQRDLENERKEKLKREKQLQVGRGVRNQIQDLRKDIKEPSKDQENAKKLVDAYLEKEKADYAPLHDARGKKKNVMEQFPLTDKEEAQAKRIFAGNVMREMLEAENDPSRNPSQNFKTHEMINGGKLQQLSETIMAFPTFEEVYVANRPNTKNNMDMVIESTNPILHRNANTVLTAMNASIDLAAEEEQKHQAEAQEKPEEEKQLEEKKKPEEEKKHEPIEEQKPEGEKIAEEEPNKPVEDPKKEDEKQLEEKADEKPVEVKTEEDKNEEVKNEEVKNEEVKNEEVKNEEVKNEEDKNEEVKNEEGKKEEGKSEEDKKEEDKKEEEHSEKKVKTENSEAALKNEKQSENGKQPENEKKPDSGIPGMEKLWNETREKYENLPEYADVLAEKKKMEYEEGPFAEVPEKYGLLNFLTKWFMGVWQSYKKAGKPYPPLPPTIELYLDQTLKENYPNVNVTSADIWNKEMLGIEYPEKGSQKKSAGTSLNAEQRKQMPKRMKQEVQASNISNTVPKASASELREAKKDGKAKTVKRENMPVVSKKEKDATVTKPQKKVVIPSASTTVRQQAETKDPRDELGLYSLKLNSEYSDLLGISEGWELFGDKKEIYAKSSEQMQLHLDKTGMTAPPRKKEQKRSVDDSGLKSNKMNWQELVREEEKHGKEDENFQKFSKSSDAKARSDMRRQNMEREFFQAYQAYCGEDKNKIAELNSNDISVLRKLGNSSNDPKLKQYLDHRIQGLKKIEACAKKANANPGNRMDGTQKIDNGKVELEGVPLKRVQTTEHGCWAVALSNMLAYRGVYLEQDAIRTFRPDVNSYSAEDIVDANKDRSQCIAQYSDLVQKVLPNTAVNHALCAVDQANSEAEAKTQIKQKLRSVIERGLKQDNGPVALLTGNHYLTVYKMEGDQVFVQDSMDSQKPTRAMSLETLADSCSTGSYKNDSDNDINRYVFSADWLQDIEVNKEGKPMLKGELEQFADTYRQGNTKDQGKIFAGTTFNSDQYHGCQFKTKDGITITSVLPINFKNYRKLTKDSFTDVQKDMVKDVKKVQADGLRRTKSFSEVQSGKKL